MLKVPWQFSELGYHIYLSFVSLFISMIFFSSLILVLRHFLEDLQMLTLSWKQPTWMWIIMKTLGRVYLLPVSLPDGRGRNWTSLQNLFLLSEGEPSNQLHQFWYSMVGVGAHEMFSLCWCLGDPRASPCTCTLKPWKNQHLHPTPRIALFIGPSQK